MAEETINIQIIEEVEEITISIQEISRTSELINDGQDGVHPFITAEDVAGGAVESVNGQTGVVVLDAQDVGAYTTTEIDTIANTKVDKVVGKGLSTNDYTDVDKNKLAGAELTANKQNNLNIDGTGTKYPTVDAVNAGLLNVNTDAVDKISVKLGVAINKGEAVYISSATGTNMIVSKASNTTEATSSKTLGLLETTGVLNDFSKVITLGLFSGLNTSTATIGDPVFLGDNGNIIFGLANKPTAPLHLVYLGIVTRVSATVGEIFVKVQNGFELEELHNVAIITPTNEDFLQYESSTSLWRNVQLTATWLRSKLDAIYTTQTWVNSQGFLASISDATDSIKGIMKLYTTTGANVDGTMTQKSITDLQTANEQDKLVKTADSTGLTGTTAEAQVDIFTIPAGKFTTNDVLKIKMAPRHVGVGGNWQFFIRIGQTNVYSASALLATQAVQSSGNLSGSDIERYVGIRGATNLDVFNATVGAQFENGSALGNARTNITTVNVTQQFYIFIGCKNGSATDTSYVAQTIIKRLRST